MNLSFELTEVDVYQVMVNHGMVPSDEDVSVAFELLDHSSIEDAALSADVDDDDEATLNGQTSNAYAEIAAQLKRAGLIPLDPCEAGVLACNVAEDVKGRSAQWGWAPTDESVRSAVIDSASQLGYTNLSAQLVDRISQEILGHPASQSPTQSFSTGGDISP